MKYLSSEIINTLVTLSHTTRVQVDLSATEMEIRHLLGSPGLLYSQIFEHHLSGGMANGGSSGMLMVLDH